LFELVLVGTLKFSIQMKDNKQVSAWAKFSQMGIQMLATIGLGTWLGYWLDGKFAMKNPIFTVILSLTSIAAALYNIIRQLPKDDEA
jgi:ATP synthase protein I